jgi:hypothetical protein
MVNLPHITTGRIARNHLLTRLTLTAAVLLAAVGAGSALAAPAAAESTTDGEGLQAEVVEMNENYIAVKVLAPSPEIGGLLDGKFQRDIFLGVDERFVVHLECHHPPSTTIDSAVMYLDWSLARNRAAFAMSSGSPNDRSGTCSLNDSAASSSCSVASRFVIAVSMTPGWMTFARMPCGPICVATEYVNSRTAPLEAL